jgi:hypothetical protein
VISGYAIVAENAVISGNARVEDTALVMGNASVRDNAKVIESACVYGNYTMTENACAKGMAFCMADGSISGQGTVDGDYYDDGGKTVTKGTAYGWVSAQSYVDGLPYTDQLIAAYDFDTDSSASFSDRYTSTYGTTSGNPVWEASRTSASGVLTLDGNDDYAQLDRSLLYTKNLDLQIAFLSRSQKTDEVLLYLGNDTAYLKILASNADGCPEVVFSDGTTTETLTASTTLSLGTWNILRVVLDGDTGTLSLNGESVATGTITIDPDTIANAISVSDTGAAYRLGADNHGAHALNGSIDFVRVYSGAAQAPTETYTGQEEIPICIETGSVGDLDLSGSINILDLVLLKQYLLYDRIAFSSFVTIADLNGDGGCSLADAVLMQKYLLGCYDLV